MAKTRSKRLVLDASILKAAGEIDAKDETSRACRTSLMCIRSVCHRAVVSDRLKAEWDKHQSRFAATWRASMVSLGKLVREPDSDDESLQESIRTSVKDESIRRVLVKDVMLIASALRNDRTILSLDDRARGHFSELARSVAELLEIVWVNPSDTSIGLEAWLEQGAKPRASLELGGIRRRSR